MLQSVIGERERANPYEQIGNVFHIYIYICETARSSVYVYLNTRNVPKWRTPRALFSINKFQITRAPRARTDAQPTSDNRRWIELEQGSVSRRRLL